MSTAEVVTAPRLAPLAAWRPGRALLVGVVAAGAALRFAGLGAQSFWYDESFTVYLLHQPFGAMLGHLAQTESTPPLYYVVAWLWVRVFGASEWGLRSVSALAGTLTVPVAYAAAARLVGSRTALAAPALTALSPPLVWYAQEARSYALFTLACALSLWAFTCARRHPTRGNLAWWVVSSGVALATHYFAGALVALEALFLLTGPASRRRAAVAAGALTAGGLTLLPLALAQGARGSPNWISGLPLTSRLGATARLFLVGPFPPRHGTTVVASAAVGVVLLAGWGVWRARPPTRRSAALALGLGVGVLVLALAARAAGHDFLLDRNLLPAWLPLAIFVAAGLVAAGRPGLLVLGLACLVLLTIDLRVQVDANAQRDDWRGVAGLLGPARAARVVEVAPGWQAVPLALYAPTLTPLATPTQVREVDTVLYTGGRAYLAPVTVRPPPPPFRRVLTQLHQRFVLVRYRAPWRALVRPADLRSRGANGSYPFRQLTP